MGDMADDWLDRQFGFTNHNQHRRVRSTKGNTMALTPKQRLRKLENELDANLSLQQRLREEEADLRKDISKVDIPDEPPASAGNMFLIEVQYQGGTEATIYEYLLMRCNKRWYTTGTTNEQKMFASWLDLCAWLNSTYWHGALSTLVVQEPRRYPTTHETQEPPF